MKLKQLIDILNDLEQNISKVQKELVEVYSYKNKVADLQRNLDSAQEKAKDPNDHLVKILRERIKELESENHILKQRIDQILLELDG